MVKLQPGPDVNQAASLRVWHVSKEFPSADGGVTPGALALDDVSLSVAAGELVSIVGPSGCGKSTLLRMIAGLTEPTVGELAIGAEPITMPSAERGLVFQDPNLFPMAHCPAEHRSGPRRSRRAPREARRSR